MEIIQKFFNGALMEILRVLFEGFCGACIVIVIGGGVLGFVALLLGAVMGK